MKEELLQQVAELADTQDHVWIATTDTQGQPHLTTAGRLLLPDQRHIILREWFCPTTVENAKTGRAAAIVVWPGDEAEGFQLLGRIEEVRTHSVLNGYDPAAESAEPMPQVQRDMVLRIDEVLRFRRGPHTDKPESGQPGGPG